jgi:hypothetical protein
MVADRGLEGDAGIEERLVGHFELGRVVLRGVTIVDVVAEHQHQVVFERLAPCDHLLRNLVLGPGPATRIADHRPLHGSRAVRQGERAAGRLDLGADEDAALPGDVRREFAVAARRDRQGQRE